MPAVLPVPSCASSRAASLLTAHAPLLTGCPGSILHPFPTPLIHSPTVPHLRVQRRGLGGPGHHHAANAGLVVALCEDHAVGQDLQGDEGCTVIALLAGAIGAGRLLRSEAAPQRTA